MIEKILDKLFGAVQRYKEDALSRRFGGIQQCPWCRQIAQSEKGWNFRVCEDSPGYDVLTCGVCRGTSKWFWGMGMHFVCPLQPPVPIRLPIAAHDADKKSDKVDSNARNHDESGSSDDMVHFNGDSSDD